MPTVPAPQPTPTPLPGSEPESDPVPAIPGGGGVSSSCGEPVPPPVSRMNVKVHSANGDRTLLDSTPMVGPDAAYCKRIGFTDGRTFCPVRVEGHPERQACEAARVGRAADSGRPGPTWSANGKRCNGPDGGVACLNHPDNQYLVFAYGSGTFQGLHPGRRLRRGRAAVTAGRGPGSVLESPPPPALSGRGRNGQANPCR